MIGIHMCIYLCAIPWRFGVWLAASTDYIEYIILHHVASQWVVSGFSKRRKRTLTQSLPRSTGHRGTPEKAQKFRSANWKLPFGHLVENAACTQRLPEITDDLPGGQTWERTNSFGAMATSFKNCTKFHQNWSDFWDTLPSRRMKYEAIAIK